MNKKKYYDLITQNSAIRESLYSKFAKLSLLYVDVIDDAAKHGRVLQSSAISRYFKHKGSSHGSLNAEDILWLCTRYSIEIKISTNSLRHSEKDALLSIKNLDFNDPDVDMKFTDLTSQHEKRDNHKRLAG